MNQLSPHAWPFSSISVVPSVGTLVEVARRHDLYRPLQGAASNSHPGAVQTRRAHDTEKLERKRILYRGWFKVGILICQRMMAFSSYGGRAA